MTYAAQCRRCKYQRARGANVIGCLRFEKGSLDSDTTGVLTRLLYASARNGPCAGYEKLEFGPDAYRALDLPTE